MVALTLAQISAIPYQAVLGEMKKTAEQWKLAHETPEEKLRRVVGEIRKEHDLP